MSNIPSKAAIEARKVRYTPGTRVELIFMDDAHTSLKSGDRGFVIKTDDIGTVHI